MTKNKLQDLVQMNKSLLFSVEDVFNTSDKVVLSKWSSAAFWGFSSLIEPKINITVPKGYHNAYLNKHFKINQKAESKFNLHIFTFIDEGVNYKVYSPERTLVEIIKDAKGFFNDVLIDAIKTFFDTVEYSHKKLMEIAKEYKVHNEIMMAKAMHGIIGDS